MSVIVEIIRNMSAFEGLLTVTGESTRWTLDSSTRISRAFEHKALTSHSLMISQRRSCSICRSKSDVSDVMVVFGTPLHPQFCLDRNKRTGPIQSTHPNTRSRRSRGSIWTQSSTHHHRIEVQRELGAFTLDSGAGFRPEIDKVFANTNDSTIPPSQEIRRTKQLASLK